ncbi:MAG: hypothetical protein JWQ48_2627 [Conexibacter sp.]|jgi:hypothetical protein|nr:hypothetical protein [Conexibacter sp.]
MAVELTPHFWDEDEQRARFAAESGKLTVSVRAGEHRYERVLEQFDAVDRQDLREASRSARAAEQEQGLGLGHAAAASWRRAAERLFPELRGLPDDDAR